MFAKSNLRKNQINILFLNNWNEYYQNIEKPTIHGETLFSDLTFDSNDKTLSLTKDNSYVYNCYFSELSAYDGGAILYSVVGKNLLVEKCFIYNCSASHYTAGIRVTKGNCIIAFVCSQNGYADGSDGFCSIASELINCVFDSSISHCEAKGSHTMYNKANSYSAVYCIPNQKNEETNHGIDIIFCSFSNNTAIKDQCIRIKNEQNNLFSNEIQNSNIIGNNASNTIHSQGQTNIYHCSIMKNGNPCFSLEDENSKFTIHSCYIDSLNEAGSVSFFETKKIHPFILALTFYETGDCHNLFVQFLPSLNCRTFEKRNILHNKLILNCLFISLLSHSFFK